MSAVLPAPLIDVDWLAMHLCEVTVLDASPADRRDDAHTIGGAQHFNIDGPLSANSPLPHTMPSAAQFEREVRRLGVDDGAPIVVYDTMGVWSSPRAWWMFRAMGHEQVAVLDGGFPAWTKAGQPTMPGAQPRAGTFIARPEDQWFVGIDTVRNALAAGLPVVDARSRARFEGREAEPRPGLRSGHMPGATNLPYTEILDGGRFAPSAQLERQFPDDQTIFTCGSGMTACILAFGATLAGRTGLRVYDGSWSEWGLGENPVA